MCPEMIRFYAESRVAAQKILPTTAPQVMEKLTRIFSELEKDYGVVMDAEKISGVSAKVLQSWFNASSGRFKEGSLNNYVSILRPFLQWAAVMEYLPKDYSNVSHTVALPNPDKLPPEMRPKDKYASDEQVHGLLSSKAGHNVVRDRAIMGLIL